MTPCKVCRASQNRRHQCSGDGRTKSDLTLWVSILAQVVPVPTDDLLSKEYAKRRRAELFNPNKASRPFADSLPTG